MRKSSLLKNSVKPQIQTLPQSQPKIKMTKIAPPPQPDAVSRVINLNLKTKEADKRPRRQSEVKTPRLFDDSSKERPARKLAVYKSKGQSTPERPNQPRKSSSIEGPKHNLVAKTSKQVNRRRISLVQMLI